tara:strand:+ start:1317 stop:1661 length:345 start_codon:yes stop_codon:yes gene_type:complete
MVCDICKADDAQQWGLREVCADHLIPPAPDEVRKRASHMKDLVYNWMCNDPEVLPGARNVERLCANLIGVLERADEQSRFYLDVELGACCSSGRDPMHTDLKGNIMLKLWRADL